MKTALTAAKEPLRRKLIDIPDGVFRVLSVKAAAMGLNLKNYIEQLLVEEAGVMDDAEIYRILSASRPEGHVKLGKEEKADFEKWLDENRG